MTRPPVLADLEAWLIGTPDQLDAALAALATAGRVVYRSPRHRLTGADHGRHRQYVRVAVPLPTVHIRPSAAA